MRIPLDWLREFVPVPAEHRAEDVMADLVRVGLEEEDVHRPAAELQGPIVVGQVLSKEPEPQKNGKTINWCSVRVVPEGAAQPLTGEGIEPSGVQGIVCGAHNFEVGDKVVVTLPGAVLPGDFRISPRKTYGHVSAGMIASSTELGMGDDGTDGIIVLGDLGLDPEPGTDARDVLDLHGEAAEINVTPDRGYAFSMRGVAREYAHATGVPFTDPAAAVHPPAADDAGPAVRIDDDAPIHGEPGATRFVARTVSGVDATRPTPPWLAARLRLAGIRTISLPVDISNYVMWELGQPLHFYDADTLSGEIVVRRARAGETLTTLDGKERELDPEDLLITDDSGPIGLAGVMGGAATEVTDATTTIVVESANFDPVSIARTRRRHRLPSEASKRNERGVDWEVADEAAERAVQLLVELAGGTPSEVVRAGSPPSKAKVVAFDPGQTLRLGGVDVPEAEQRRILESLGFAVGADWQVTCPLRRHDIEGPADLVEEVVRIHGLDKVASVALPRVEGVARPTATPQQKLERGLRRAAAASGLNEAVTWSFLPTWAAEHFGSDQPLWTLANPISEDMKAMRPSLLPGLLMAAKRNADRGAASSRLFEIGRRYFRGANGLSDEKPTLGIVLAGEKTPRGWQSGKAQGFDAYDVKALALALLEAAGAPVANLMVMGEAGGQFHPGQSATLRLGPKVVLARFGMVHPSTLKAFDADGPIAAVELFLDAIPPKKNAAFARPGFTPPALQPVTRDFAFLVPATLAAGDLVRAVLGADKASITGVRVFDVFAGQGVPEGKKSVAVEVTLQPGEASFKDADLKAIAEKVVAAAAKLGGELRG